ncbi:hypothetical protein CNBE2410 [Cryptococcus deneoformans B-3501A]|uniref:hypothetical protein n=1 Tax=Cryptococcus deneoformans (strain B-3501A) TaxID=283643 RepID=UPI000042D4E5|nr:hypothetical protein CNBE2410 [Cryptococcus neoformans var. neoformans B-3501A]EAL20880.1 hypothetical protein CNBE2410 [Cryptococcus neoformans var. neoformans B-3501A]
MSQFQNDFPAPSSPDSAPKSGAGAADARPQRSRDGCLTCRSRKVKCGEQRPICDRCRIKSRECVWPSEDEAERRRNKKRKASGARAPYGSSYYGSMYSDQDETSPVHLPAVSVPVEMRRPPKHAIKGTVHVPPNFLPPEAMAGQQVDAKGKQKLKDERRDELVDWLVPEKLRAEMMMEPTFLQPYFRTVDERLVMRHYLSKTVHIIIAFESDHRPWNPWLSIHAPLAFQHLPGTKPAADALRAAILAVGGVHLQYSNSPDDRSAAYRITKSAKVQVLKLVKETLQSPDGRPRQLTKEDIELVLASLLSCTIASSLAADDSWHHLLSSVLGLIDQLGGAHHILRDAPRDRLSPYRFFMEQLAIRDVFGCMTTELAPSILQDAFTPWFFEAESWSRTDVEWESVERMFGISRGMVDMIARVCTLIAAVRTRGRPIFMDPDDSPSLLPTDPNPSAPPSNLTELQLAAQNLMAEIRVWDEAENFTPLHPRTQYGNLAYRHAIKIRMLRKVYDVPSDDERVASSAESIIELAAEMLAFYGKITWLTWPIVIAGFEIPRGHPSRQTALGMLGAFGPHACFDNRAGARILSDYWMWHDMDGDHATSWEMANILNQRPFLD